MMGTYLLDRLNNELDQIKQKLKYIQNHPGKIDSLLLDWYIYPLLVLLWTQSTQHESIFPI